MAEKNKDERTTARSAVENALVKALSDDMGEIPEVSITVEELKALDAADKKKRRKRAARCASVAAVAVIVCAAVVYMAWPETVVPVDADKNTEQRVETGDGEIVINEGDGIGESGIVEIDETDWDKVKSYRKQFPKLGIPMYIPTGFTFERLHIETYDADGFYFQYVYINDTQRIYISQREYKGAGNNATGFLKGEGKAMETKVGTAYIVSEDENSLICIKLNDNGYLEIKGAIAEKEIVKILEQIDMP